MVLGLMIAAGRPITAQAQVLSERVLGLYPPEAGEVVFVDLQAARRSPHFAQVKAQVLPERFQQLERLAANLGLDFDQNVDRLSWAYVNTGDPARADFMGVAEGAFDLGEIKEAAKQRKLQATAYRGARMFTLGKNDKGQEFIFAFPDDTNCLFGFSEPVQAMLDRATDGGPSLLNNDKVRALVNDVNRTSPVWMVMDGDFTQLGVRQFLGDAIRIPGVETLSGRVRTATVRIDLGRGLESKIAAHCATSADALWLSTFLQGALVVERQLLSRSNPIMARILGSSQVQRAEGQLSLALTIPESDLATLIQKNGLALHF